MRVFTPDEMFNPNEYVSIKVQKVDYYIEPHKHNFIEIIFVKSGKGIHCINGVDYSISRGSLLIANNESIHSIRPDGFMEYYNIFVKPEFFFNEFYDKSNLMDTVFINIFEEFKINESVDRSFAEFQSDEIEILESNITLMYKEYLEKKPGYEKITESLLYIILTYVMRKMMIPTEKEADKTQMLTDILSYIDKNYNQKITAKELAEKCFYNPSYFSRIFKEVTGKTMVEYIQDLRIKNACVLLECSSKTIDEISVDVGYANPTRFYEIFKKTMGTTPHGYRQEILKGSVINDIGNV